MDNKHDKILTDLKSGKYNLFWLENELNIPKTILSHAISGRRNIPKKYIEPLFKELRLV